MAHFQLMVPIKSAVKEKVDASKLKIGWKTKLSYKNSIIKAVTYLMLGS